MIYILVLIYSGLSVVAEPRADLDSCAVEAAARIGEPAKVRAWDNMNGSNPVPEVVVAFCVRGSASEIAK